ncbi:hypothetical protein CERSUDRAFT_103994 [Gelatoporia subvermispora B]|uniref:FAD-binding domain-containing protein n=1 Tax=Ceriporiopsis subvermispora (strain B) TaxID=914234 RepID=M2R6A0_CERS8|nr:hypothetical protein CERSUDRAFT_103994 [Gelatoporia subvermispora B]
MPPQSENPILIIGAGVAGLTLAQCLRQRSIPYLIFERDSGPSSRHQGWGLTLHWILNRFLSALPPAIRSDIYSCQVDGAPTENDTGDFLFVDLANLDVKYKVPPSKRMRVQREKLRRLLMRDIDIAWSKQLSNLEVTTEGVIAHFRDGSEYRGRMLIGADGSQSQVRNCVASQPSLKPLPVQMLGVKVTLSADQAAPLRNISPLLFQGSVASTGTFLYASLFDVEDAPGGVLHTWQLCLSFPKEDEPSKPRSHVEAESILRDKLLAKARELHPDLQRPFQQLPPDAPVIPITIADWDYVAWDGKGRVTLLGDAAHAMTMFRGDGANHAIADVLELVEVWEKHSLATGGGEDVVAKCIQKFEDAMRPRARAAVLNSRQACLDAHSLGRLAENSPVVSDRA